MHSINKIEQLEDKIENVEKDLKQSELERNEATEV